jgi:hypothetical protein
MTENDNNELHTKKKTGPKGPFKYDQGCFNDPTSPSYKPYKGIGRGKAPRREYKNKRFVRITIEEYDELMRIKKEHLNL